MLPIVRAEYEALAKNTTIFKREADRLRQGLQRIQRTLEILQGGDWVGEGADAFYRELTSEVLPAMQRLVSALEAGARTTRAIAQIIKDLEEEMARLFAAILAAFAGTGAGGSAAAAVAAAVGSGASAAGKPGLAQAQAGGVARINDAIKKLDVEHNAKFLPGNGKTWCNQYVMSMAKEVGAPLPQWLDFDKDHKPDDDEWLNANRALQWMRGDLTDGGPSGPAQGWSTVSADEAATLASQGRFVVAGWENTGGPHGHMAVVRPDSTPNHILISQAGGKNFASGTIRQGFGKHPVEYFVYRRP